MSQNHVTIITRGFVSSIPGAIGSNVFIDLLFAYGAGVSSAYTWPSDIRLTSAHAGC